ncbi:MAG: N-acetyltransferase [Desulfobacteraceae bacterium]|nr:MAG: N-acetyltransferase [Desulfobacteraceae bacterium]
MANPNQKIQTLLFSEGSITIKSFCSPDEIALLSLKDTFVESGHYNPILTKKESLIDAALKPDANVTLAYTENKKIIGISILRYPNPDERWSKIEGRVMMEVAVTEVSGKWRLKGISKNLLGFLLDHPLMEDRIIYMVGYSWTWDISGTNKSVIEYRNILINLFSHFGFGIYPTNELNIMLRPENLFMARIGANISESIRKRFKLVRFNLNE